MHELALITVHAAVTSVRLEVATYARPILASAHGGLAGGGAGAGARGGTGAGGRVTGAGTGAGASAGTGGGSTRCF